MFSCFLPLEGGHISNKVNLNESFIEFLCVLNMLTYHCIYKERDDSFMGVKRVSGDETLRYCISK